MKAVTMKKRDKTTVTTKTSVHIKFYLVNGAERSNLKEC